MSATDDVVEAMARGMWEVFCASKARSDEWPSWAELLAQGHQGMHRINEFRGYARAAIRAVPPGWALVPTEPTEEMCDAGWIDKEDVSPAEIWRAMLEAAVRASAVEIKG